jgi:predicted Fe-Mo cluster-binding NifX family protein
MKIAVSAEGSDLASTVDPRFGRCSYFVFYDTDTQETTAKANGAVSSGHGAGIQAAQSILSEGVGAVIAGRVGPNAWQVLRSAGLSVYECPAIPISEALDRLESGSLRALNGPTGRGHGGRG